ncbi:MAG: arginine--tRNA ligase, partial [Bacteroidales bacterium]|nr:arginine--tRNA ligase [Bacteroidales bacterium]
PLLKITKKSPEQSAREIGKNLVNSCPEIESFNVIKGFLNLVVDVSYWEKQLLEIIGNREFGIQTTENEAPLYMIEFSSPNTNKPLHLGHIRNNLIGSSLSRIMEANGKSVRKVNLVNDRGIHICKSMLAWKKWGDGATPESTHMKGDHLVGDYYVMFDREYKKQVQELIAGGLPEEKATKEAGLLKEAQEMLRKWEAKDSKTIDLWESMNGWVYKGFDETYDRLGVSFDQIYYESETYKLGKAIILEGLEKGMLYRKEDGSVWADLTEEGLDNKLLLRSDGTSVYMTQDVGTAEKRFSEHDIDTHIYVVGNEQDYHFQVLALILKKLGYAWAERLLHLSYGMVELPEGKMKSREGTVVDADDLMDEMNTTAREMSEELGKLEEYSKDEKEDIVNTIGLGALKYFILKVDPRKNMIFDPVESVDFNGNTGPFIQYTHARIRSVMKKAGESGIKVSSEPGYTMINKEKELAKMITRFPETVEMAGNEMNPAVIANYCYELAREFNQFYHD